MRVNKAANKNYFERKTEFNFPCNFQSLAKISKFVCKFILKEFSDFSTHSTRSIK